MSSGGQTTVRVTDALWNAVPLSAEEKETSKVIEPRELVVMSIKVQAGSAGRAHELLG